MNAEQLLKKFSTKQIPDMPGFLLKIMERQDKEKEIWEKIKYEEEMRKIKYRENVQRMYYERYGVKLKNHGIPVGGGWINKK